MTALYLDKISEAMAHFIGLFEMAGEEARLKHAYEEFRATQKASEQPPEHPSQAVQVDAAHKLDDFDPDVAYTGQGPAMAKAAAISRLQYEPVELPVPREPLLHGSAHQTHNSMYVSGGPPLPQIEPPGSLAVIINQETHLSDNDYVSFGGSGLKFTPPPADNSPLADMQQSATALSPIDDLALPGTTQDMAAFVTTATERLDSFNPEDHADADIFSVKGTTLEGTYLNGQLIDEADIPKLEDHVDLLKDHSNDQPGPGGPLDINTPPSSSDFMDGWGDGSIAPRVELTTGGNTVINNAVVVNNWASADVMAVMGNHISLNAIVQINGICDVDSIGAALGGWPFDPGNADQSFNIATFKHIDPSADVTPAEAPSGFPSNYVVTEITGDLVIMNWINQYAFMMDNDVCIASSSGVQSVVSTGDNTAYNSIDLNEIGKYYDLIIVGGNVYDANIIQQLNLLLDNDTIGAVSGFETTGEGSVSTADNLLWNQAAIIEVGSGITGPLPEGYAKAGSNLAAGNKDLPHSILEDPAFAGTGLLRVLYISGDIYNLQYVKQTTIVGDSDQVALAMNEVLANPNADWTVTTGGNQLVNYATIVDVDTATKTYVGGESYSDEVLIQANLIPSTPFLGTQNPDILVNEAVAFLTDATGTDAGASSHDHITPQPADSGSADVMQHMLG